MVQKDKWYSWLGLDPYSPEDKPLLHIAEVGKNAEIPFPWEWWVVLSFFITYVINFLLQG